MMHPYLATEMAKERVRDFHREAEQHNRVLRPPRPSKRRWFKIGQAKLPARSYSR
jgi:hypothetical protein